MNNFNELTISYITLSIFILTIIFYFMMAFYLGQKLYRISINYLNYNKKRKYFSNNKQLHIPIVLVVFLILVLIGNVFIYLNGFLSEYFIPSLILFVFSIFQLFVGVYTEYKIFSLKDFDQYYTLIENIFSNEKKLIDENQSQYELLKNLEQNIKEITNSFSKYLNNFETNMTLQNLNNKIEYNRNFLITETQNLIQVFDDSLKTYIKEKDLSKVILENPFSSFSHHEIFEKIDNLKKTFKSDISKELNSVFKLENKLLSDDFEMLSNIIQHQLNIDSDIPNLLLEKMSNDKNKLHTDLMMLLVQNTLITSDELFDFLVKSSKHKVINNQILSLISNQNKFKYLYELSIKQNFEFIEEWIKYLDASNIRLIQSLIHKLAQQNVVMDVFQQFIEINTIDLGFHQNHSILEDKMLALIDFNIKHNNKSNYFTNEVIETWMHALESGRIHQYKNEIESYFDKINELLQEDSSQIQSLIKFIIKNNHRFQSLVSKENIIREYHTLRLTLNRKNLSDLKMLLISLMKLTEKQEDLNYLKEMNIGNDILANYQTKNYKQFLDNYFSSNSKTNIYDIVSRIEHERLLIDRIIH
jgi:hypothetical protein